MQFGQLVRTMRTARGMSQQDLAQVVRVDNSILSRIETGLVIPTEPLAAAIRAALAWGPAEDQALAILAGESETVAEREVA